MQARHEGKKVGCWIGGMKDSRYAGQVECRIVGMQDKMDTGLKGCTWDSGEEGSRQGRIQIGGMLEKEDAGQEEAGKEHSLQADSEEGGMQG